MTEDYTTNNTNARAHHTSLPHARYKPVIVGFVVRILLGQGGRHFDMVFNKNGPILRIIFVYKTIPASKQIHQCVQNCESNK